MSELSEFSAAPASASEPDSESRPQIRAAATDVLLSALVFTVLGLIAAFIWWKVTPLAAYTRTADNGSMGEEELAKQINGDGWFFVITAAGGLVSGILLTLWRRRDPVLTVLLVGLGGLLAAWITTAVGLALGPADPADALPGARVGAQVPLQLAYEAKGLFVTWAIFALVASFGVIWGTSPKPEDGR